VASILLAVNASFYERVARLEEKEEAVFEEEKVWQGRVEGRLESLGRQATLGLSLDVARGVQRPVLAVFSLLLGVATNRTSFMLLCLLISFFFVPFSTVSYLIFVLGGFCRSIEIISTKSANVVGFLDFVLVRKLFLTSPRSPFLILNLFLNKDLPFCPQLAPS
jgi:hypothetical protein